MPMTGMQPNPMTQAPANVGAATVPQGNQGNIQMAALKIRNALKMMQEALPLIPMGDPLHAELLKTVQSIAKHIKQEESNPQLEQAAMISQLRQQAQQAPQAAIARQMAASAGQGQPPAGPATPPVPPTPNQ